MDMIRQIAKNALVVTTIFVVITLVALYAQEGFVVDWVSMIATIMSVTYVVTIRDPRNYLAFLLGALSSFILVFSMWESQTNGALTYLLIFLPAQSYSFWVWRKRALLAKRGKTDSGTAPRWQTPRERMLSVVAMLVLMAINVVCINLLSDGYSHIALLFNALFFASSILANVLIVYKLVESGVYWIIFSISGLGMAMSRGEINLFFILMFVLFLIVNTMLLMSWVKKAKNR